MIKISVIVPVYNVEKYLDKCLDSLVKQTLKEIEIIVVNDGTKDNSQEIVDKYVKKYPKKVKSYIKENGGLSSARNYGLKYANGEYIGFVDSDDWVEKDMYEKMYNKAKKSDFDLVVCDLKYVYDDKKVNAYSNIKNDLSESDIKNSMINIYPAAWNKIYKKDLFNNGVLFKEKIWFEDVEFLYRLFPYIKSIGVVKEPFYNYVQRQGAITSTFDKRLYDYIDNWNGIIDYYLKEKFYDKYKKELEYNYVRYLYATFVKRVANFKDKEMYKEAVTSAIENVKKRFPKYRRNSYFYKSLKGIYLLVFNKCIALLYYKLVNRK